ncbi:MAG: YbaN family protein [Christensenellales bacterium]
MISKSRLLIVLGFVLLAIGAAGIVLPVLPTTPFVLAAAACFSGSARLTAWLHKSRVFSDYITNYKERKGLQKRSVLISLTFLWVTLGVSVALIKALWAAIFLPCVGIAVTIHILYMARRPKGKAAKCSKIQTKRVTRR